MTIQTYALIFRCKTDPPNDHSVRYVSAAYLISRTMICKHNLSFLLQLALKSYANTLWCKRFFKHSSIVLTWSSLARRSPNTTLWITFPSKNKQQYAIFKFDYKIDRTQTLAERVIMSKMAFFNYSYCGDTYPKTKIILSHKIVDFGNIVFARTDSHIQGIKNGGHKQ